jgi:electron transfer flavoprotein alpha subunit
LRTPRAAAPATVTDVLAPAVSRVRVLAKHREDDSDELATASVVVGVGVGVHPDDYPMLRSLCARFGAVLCATRKVTDKGWMPRARQVGITGHSIAPGLFISLGASGKFNHTVGMRAAGTIVAVNTDPDAPIFGWADVGVVGDWKTVLPALTPLLETARKG